MISNLLENIYSFKHAVEINAQLLGEYSRNLKNQEGVNDGQFPIQEEFINVYSPDWPMIVLLWKMALQ